MPAHYVNVTVMIDADPKAEYGPAGRFQSDTEIVKDTILIANSSDTNEETPQCEGPQCPICYVDFSELPKDVDRLRTKCGHEFCSTCFLQSVDPASNKCPYCRTELFDENSPIHADSDTKSFLSEFDVELDAGPNFREDCDDSVGSEPDEEEVIADFAFAAIDAASESE